MRFEVHPGESKQLKASTESSNDISHLLADCARGADVVARGTAKGFSDTAQKRWNENPAGLIGEGAFMVVAGITIGILAKRNPLIAQGLTVLGGTSFAVTSVPRIPFKDFGTAIDTAMHSSKKEDLDRAANLVAKGVDGPVFDLGMAIMLGGPAAVLGPRAYQRMTFNPSNYIRPVEPPAVINPVPRDISFGPTAFRSNSGWIIPGKSNRLGLIAEEPITLETVRQPSADHTGLRFYFRTSSETQAMRTPPRRIVPTFTEQP